MNNSQVFAIEGLVVFFLICLVCIVVISYITFRMVFYWNGQEHRDPFRVPTGPEYKPYEKQMNAWIDRVLKVPYEMVSIRSFDGLKLVGKYYHVADGAPIELMMHGYHGVAERDFSGGHGLALSMGHNVLLIDERAHGDSEGHVLSFGILESRDCLSWVEYLIQRFGRESKIILSGVSMGAATVLMAPHWNLPDNVVGIMADCGYSSPQAIIRRTMKNMHLPVNILYPFVRLGGFLFGHFRIESNSALEGMKQCRIPVLLLHGEADTFVPCSMAYEIYEACPAKDKTLFTVPGAPHAISMMVDCEGYSAKVREFCESSLNG